MAYEYRSTFDGYRESGAFHDWTDFATAADEAAAFRALGRKGVRIVKRPVLDKEALREAAAKVTRIYHGLANDENDGEFALWAQTDLINAIVDLDLVLCPQPSLEQMREVAREEIEPEAYILQSREDFERDRVLSEREYQRHRQRSSRDPTFESHTSEEAREHNERIR